MWCCVHAKLAQVSWKQRALQLRVIRCKKRAESNSGRDFLYHPAKRSFFIVFFESLATQNVNKRWRTKLKKPANSFKSWWIYSRCVTRTQVRPPVWISSLNKVDNDVWGWRHQQESTFNKWFVENSESFPLSLYSKEKRNLPTTMHVPTFLKKRRVVTSKLAEFAGMVTYQLR